MTFLIADNWINLKVKKLLLIVDAIYVVVQGIVKVGAVDADQHNSLGGQYGVRGFPTIKLFGANKNKPEDYQGSVLHLQKTSWHAHKENIVWRRECLLLLLSRVFSLSLCVLGGRSSQAIVDSALNTLRTLVKDRLGGKTGGSDYGKQVWKPTMMTLLLYYYVCILIDSLGSVVIRVEEVPAIRRMWWS